MIYLHGSAYNIGANVNHARRFKELGFTVLLISYRGYGQSEGNFPSEAQVYADAEAAWNYLVRQKGINPGEIFIYGHSLETFLIPNKRIHRIVFGCGIISSPFLPDLPPF